LNILIFSLKGIFKGFFLQHLPKTTNKYPNKFHYLC
jgi:hypothetical protein